MLSKKAKEQLVQLADDLDQKGFGEEADMVDGIINDGSTFISIPRDVALNELPGKWKIELNDEEHRFGPFNSSEEAQVALANIKTYPGEDGIVSQWTTEGLSSVLLDPEDEETYYPISYMNEMFPTK